MNNFRGWNQQDTLSCIFNFNEQDSTRSIGQ